MPALILPGGGARGAYQVGVLKAIGEICGGCESPFPIICGTSAGSINGTVLASHADDFPVGVSRLEHFWASMFCERIYRTDTWTVFKSALRWALSLSSGGRLISNPRSLLDNRPLGEFLQANLRLAGIQDAIANGSLHGLTVTASAYSRAAAITFFQGQPEIAEWQRARRLGVTTRIGVEHLLASSALPLLFPAVQIGNEYYGDGGMRMLSPLSPAIHLGADRVLVISTRDEKPDPLPDQPRAYPTLGEIGGYLLDTIFMDTLNADLNRLNRINHTLSLMDPEQLGRSGLRTIGSLVIRPSRDLREVTREHMREIPRSVRTLLRSLGGWGKDWRMASYLLFESAYCSELLDMGYRDGMSASQQIRDFLGYGTNNEFQQDQTQLEYE